MEDSYDLIHSNIKVATTELSRHFSDYLAQVRFGGKRIIVLKNSNPVAELRPLPLGKCSLKELFKVSGSLSFDSDFADDLEKVNRADAFPENPWE